MWEILLSKSCLYKHWCHLERQKISEEIEGGMLNGKLPSSFPSILCMQAGLEIMEQNVHRLD